MKLENAKQTGLTLSSPPGHQLALSLFEDLQPQDLAVADSQEEIGFRRNNVFIKISDMSMACRRFLDACYFLVAEDADEREHYVHDLCFFQWLMGYNSRNRGHFQKLIREAQRASIEVDAQDINTPQQDGWGSIPLMGSAAVAGGKLMFELSPKLKFVIRSPASSHFLSLRLIFSSVYSQVICELAMAYAEERVTPWLALEDFRQQLGATAKTYAQYKHFKNKVLEVAVAEVLSVANIELVVDERHVPGSRRVRHVRFLIRRVPEKAQPQLEMQVLKDTYDILRYEFGLTVRDMGEIIANRAEWDDKRIQEAIEYTRHAIENNIIRGHTKGYFMASLANGYILAKGDLRLKELRGQAAASKALEDGNKQARELASAKQKSQAQQAAASRITEEAQRGMAVFLELPAEQQDEIFAQFCREGAGAQLLNLMRVDETELRERLTSEVGVQAALVSYLKRRTKAAA